MKILSKLCQWAESIKVAYAISQMKLEEQRETANRLYNLQKEDMLNG